ncbi:hypothetical protein RCH10_005070 [Variovorax sp. GrIS 2.14]
MVCSDEPSPTSITAAKLDTELAEPLQLIRGQYEVAFRRLYEMTTSRLFGLTLFIVKYSGRT